MTVSFYNRKAYIFVGKKKGISNYHLDKSVLIRSAVRLSEKPIDMNFIEKVQKLPQVIFVKSGQFSVHPFIYKFLTEFIEVEPRNFAMRKCLWVISALSNEVTWYWRVFGVYDKTCEKQRMMYKDSYHIAEIMYWRCCRLGER